MEMNENLNRILKSTQKISERVSVFNKLTNVLKTHSSFMKSIEESQKKVFSLSNNHKFYGGGEMIPRAFDIGNTYKIVSTLYKQPMLYGGGEMISRAFDFENTTDSLRASLETLNSVVEFNNKDFFNSKEFFSSLEPLKESNSKTLDYLSTVKLVSKRNLLVHTKKKEEITKKISGLLYSVNDFPDYIPNEVLDFDCSNLYYTYENPIPNDYFSNFKFFEFFNYINDYIKCEIEIDSENQKIKWIEKLSISIKSGIRKFTLNKREFFRKINSFHFKNLDDYDSLALIT